MQELIPINKKLASVPPSNLAELQRLSKQLVETESMLSAFWLLSPTLKVIMYGDSWLKVNPACKDYLGQTAEELLRGKHKQLLHPDDISIGDELNWIIKDNTVITKFKNRYFNTETNSWVTLEWHARKDLQSGLIFATALDKTVELKQKQDIEKLASLNLEEKAKLLRALDLCTVGVFVADNNGLCTYVNQEYCKLAGLTAEEAIGKGWEKALCSDEEARITAEWYEYTQLAKSTPNIGAFETISCYHNKKNDKRTTVKIYAYFYDEESIIAYATPV